MHAPGPPGGPISPPQRPQRVPKTRGTGSPPSFRDPLMKSWDPPPRFAFQSARLKPSGLEGGRSRWLLASGFEGAPHPLWGSPKSWDPPKLTNPPSVSGQNAAKNFYKGFNKGNLFTKDLTNGDFTKDLTNIVFTKDLTKGKFLQRI